MKRKNNTHITLSDKAYYKYYDYKNFSFLFLSSLCQSRSFLEIIVSSVLAAVGSLAVEISYISKPREFITVVCTGLTTYSITVMGFLLISFTILIIVNSSKSAFRHFTKEDENYKAPLIRVLLGHFIIPIGIFSLLLFFSMLIGFLVPVFDVNRFGFVTKYWIFKCFLGIVIFLFIYSIFEFLSFFYNIYNFIVITSYKASSEFEQEVIKEIINNFVTDIEKDKKTIQENIEFMAKDIAAKEPPHA
jgi:hypothetical protein